MCTARRTTGKQTAVEVTRLRAQQEGQPGNKQQFRSLAYVHSKKDHRETNSSSGHSLTCTEKPSTSMTFSNISFERGPILVSQTTVISGRPPTRAIAVCWNLRYSPPEGRWRCQCLVPAGNSVSEAGQHLSSGDASH